MRRSKSSQKEAIRGIEDQIKDYVSQPLKSLNLFDNEFMKRLSSQKPPVVASQGLTNKNAPKTYSWRHYLSQEQLQLATKTGNKEPFSSKMIKEFAEGLGGDSLECYKHMYDVRSLFNKEVLAHYNNIYRELQTIPIVFLSVAKTKQNKVKAIYLWQFNELCPIDRKTSRMQIDSPVRSEVYVPHHSMLLVAKFVTSETEELWDGQFLSDSRILIKSRLSGSHVRFREYDMMDLRELVKVNPYEVKVDNRFYCASKLDVSLDASGMNCELSRIRRLAEIELLEYHQRESGVESLSMFIKTDSQKIETKGTVDLGSKLFSEVYSMRTTGYTVLIDRNLAKMVLFKKDCLKIIDLNVIGEICSIYENNNNVFYFLNQEGKVYKISLFDENPYCENLKIEIKGAQDVKFLSAHGHDYAVSLEGTKFYCTVLKQVQTFQYLFDVETIQEEQKPNIKLVWIVTQDKVVALKGSYVHVYDFKSNGLEKRELQQTELLEYKYTNVEWKLLSDKNKVFAFSRNEESLRIKTLALKETQVKKSEKQFKVNDIYTNYLVGDLRKNEGSLFARVNGTADQIIFLRLKNPYFIDDMHLANGIPCYLFSSFVFPPKMRAEKDWTVHYQNLKVENERQKLREENQKKAEKEEKEMEEYEEMKAKVNQHMKEAKVGKSQEKYQEERKEKMAEVRKAIVKSGKEEGADKLDKRLKDTKEEYMSMYQDLKKEKKKHMKEKEKNKGKDRQIERNNKKGDYE